MDLVCPSVFSANLMEHTETHTFPGDSIKVNRRSDSFNKRATELLTSDRGMMHRSNYPIEHETLFGEIKCNRGVMRFRSMPNWNVKVEFGLAAIAHYLRK